MRTVKDKYFKVGLILFLTSGILQKQIGEKTCKLAFESVQSKREMEGEGGGRCVARLN